MTDEEKIRQIRRLIADMTKAKNVKHTEGARFFLYESGSVIETISGYLDGAPNAGAQAGDTRAQTITEAMKRGAIISVGLIGYSTDDSKVSR